MFRSTILSLNLINDVLLVAVTQLLLHMLHSKDDNRICLLKAFTVKHMQEVLCKVLNKGDTTDRL